MGKAEKGRIVGAILLMAVVGLSSLGCSKIPVVGKWFGKSEEPTPSIYPTESTLPPPPDVVKADKPGEVVPVPMEGVVEPAPDDLGIPEAKPMRMEPQQTVSELQTVFFAFDSSELDEAARATLDGNYQWLSEHPGIHVLIEGHCDDRGTVEYNLNLGQRRADSVREFLIQKGLDPSTLHTISYGEERPLVEGSDEESWAMNRRVQFLVY